MLILRILKISYDNGIPLIIPLAGTLDDDVFDSYDVCEALACRIDRIRCLHYVCVDNTEIVYFTQCHTLRRLIIRPNQTDVVETLVGGYSAGNQDGVGRNATLSYPTSICGDRNGNFVYILSGDMIRQYDTRTQQVITVLNTRTMQNGLSINNIALGANNLFINHVSGVCYLDLQTGKLGSLYNSENKGFNDAKVTDTTNTFKIYDRYLLGYTTPDNSFKITNLETMKEISIPINAITFTVANNILFYATRTSIRQIPNPCTY